jgi:hypothetical protein
MKVLVAQRPAPPRSEDEVWSAMQSEVVVAPFVCPDPDCVCDRVHQGLVSHGYSTAVIVSDVETSPAALVAACRIHLDASQWAAVVEHPSELDFLAADLIHAMSETAQDHPVGTVLRMTFERRGGRWRHEAVQNQ